MTFAEEGGGAEGAHGECFFLAIAAFFHTEKEDVERMAKEFKRPPRTEDGVSLAQVTEFERLNCDRWDFAINVVYRDEEEDILPALASRRLDAKLEIVLILFHTVGWPS